MLNAIGRFIYDVLKKSISWIRSILVGIFSVIILILGLSILTGILAGSQAAVNPASQNETLLIDNGGEDKIVLIPVSGVILNEGENNVFASTEGYITPKIIRDVLDRVKTDKKVKAVIFDLNSPGGSPVASDRIFEQLLNFKQQTQIPLVFLMGDIAASGGYYIASAADFIVANPSTLTGSIGVIMETYNLEELYKKIGVTKKTFKQGEYKDILSDSRPITDEEQKIIDSLNENTYNLFISRVAQGRNKSEDQIRTLANGRIYSGSQAKDLGLIDSLGNLDEAVYQAKSLANIQNYQVVEYTTGSIWQELFGSIKVPSFLSLAQLVPFLPKTYWVQK